MKTYHIEDREVISVTAQTVPTSGAFDRFMVWLFGVTTTNNFHCIAKFWLDSIEGIVPGQLIICNDQICWYITAVGINNTIIAKTVQPQSIEALDQMSETGAFIVSGIAQSEK
jgi:hypothetical protein